MRPSGGIFDYATQQERLEEVVQELGSPSIWNTPTLAQQLGKERVALEKVVHRLDQLNHELQEHDALLALAIEEQDNETITAIGEQLSVVQNHIEALEFQRMFGEEMDPNAAFVEIQSGSGGTEAQDWADMLLRMYLRWCERQGFKVTLLEVSPAEVAGIKSATLKVEGAYAFGWLRTETGVHRLVRKSPFDSGSRRHTSFAAVFVSPVLEEDLALEINSADLKIDTYRAGGAGGQHVNRTDSAVRITHVPSGIVVQCQSDRSQHKNKAQAMSQLRARMYEMEKRKRDSAQQLIEDNKADIGWGSQIRSYVLDDSRIKDLRTGIETSNIQGMLDGNLLEIFIKASLQSGK